MPSSVSLTGDRPTRELPKITKNEPVTVAVARNVLPGRGSDFEAWARVLLDTAASFDGYLGGGVLSPSSKEGEHQLIVKFRDAKTLRRWERSTERAELLKKAESMVTSSRAVSIVGSRTLLEIAEAAAPERRLYTAVLSDTLWILPIASIAGAVLAPLLSDANYLVRTFTITAAITLTANVALNPIRKRVHKLRKGL